jgi:hypothetical protein
MAKSWQNIPLTDLAPEEPVVENDMTKFHGNQEALITGQVDTRFAQVSHNGGTFTQKTTVEVYVPPQVNTGAGDVTLPVRLEAIVDGTAVGEVRIRLGATGAYQTQTGITATAYPNYYTLTIPSANVKANADSLVNIEVELRISSGTGNVFARYVGGASRFARAA